MPGFVHSTVISRSVQTMECVGPSFLSVAVRSHVGYATCSVTCGYVGGFPALAVRNDAVTNVLGQLLGESVWDGFALWFGFAFPW